LAGLQALEDLQLVGCPGVVDLRPLASMGALRTLYISECRRLTDLGPLSVLHSLVILALRNCGRFHTFVPLFRILPGLKYLNLYGSRFDDLPDHVCGEDEEESVVDQVRGHFADMESGWQYDEEVKVFVIGNGGVGKTQLCRRLRNYSFQENDSSTHGVEIGSFGIPLRGTRTKAIVRTWDFGGQEIYHGTHALFVDRRAIFVILWNYEHEQSESSEGNVAIGGSAARVLGRFCSRSSGE
jgi:internalin A